MSATATEDSRPNVAIETSLGRIVLELYWDHAPKACLNLVTLAKTGRLKNQVFGRVVANFLIQTGGQPAQRSALGDGSPFEDEVTKDLKHVGAGILSMANSGRPNSNGAQFFIILAPQPQLDGKHTIFGRVAEGMRVVQKLGALETDSQARPVKPVLILEASVVSPSEQ